MPHARVPHSYHALNGLSIKRGPYPVISAKHTNPRQMLPGAFVML